MDIEAGDRVRVIQAESGAHLADGKEGTLVTTNNILEDNKTCLGLNKDYALKLGEPYSSHKGYVDYLVIGDMKNIELELIYKGEDNMENYNGIAFKVENKNLLDALVDELEEIGIEIRQNVYRSNNEPRLGQYFGTDEEFSGADHFSNLSNERAYCVNENIKILQFPQDWNKIIEYFEENAKPDTPEIKTEHGSVEFYDDHIEVGCKNISNETIEQVYDSLNKLANEVTTSRKIQLTVRGAEFTMEEIEQIAEYQL